MKKKLTLSLCALAVVASCAYAANEIMVNFSMKVTKGSLDIQRTCAQNYTLMGANPNVAGFTQLITTNPAGTALTLGDVATNGVAWFRNLNTNTANYVEVGVSESNTFYGLIRLQATEAWPVRLSVGVTPYARAAGGSVVLEKVIVDN